MPFESLSFIQLEIQLLKKIYFPVHEVILYLNFVSVFFMLNHALSLLR